MKKGDWVKARLWGYDIIGYIENIWNESVQITKVLKVKEKEIQRIKPNPALCELSKVEPIPPVFHPEDTQALIDLALDTKDKEWFDELTRRQKNESAKTI